MSCDFHLSIHIQVTCAISFHTLITKYIMNSFVYYSRVVHTETAIAKSHSIEHNYNNANHYLQSFALRRGEHLHHLPASLKHTIIEEL